MTKSEEHAKALERFAGNLAQGSPEAATMLAGAAALREVAGLRTRLEAAETLLHFERRDATHTAARAALMETALRDIRSAAAQFNSEHAAGYDLIHRYCRDALRVHGLPAQPESAS